MAKIYHELSDTIVQANSSRIFEFDMDALRLGLNKIHGHQSVYHSSEVWLELPSIKGNSSVLYRVTENSTMSPGLAARFPDISTYNGTTSAGATVKLDITPQGFHAMIMEPGQPAVFIDPYSQYDDRYYIMYSRKALIASQKVRCDVKEVSNQPVSFLTRLFSTPFSSCTLKKYRLALAATYQYTQFTGGTKERALATQITTVNRINGIYENDAGVTFELIPNNDLLICDYAGCPTGGGTQPYTNGVASALINENQVNVDLLIGPANYDVGHVVDKFNETNGLAGVGVVCDNGQKGRGVTIGVTPVGDAFDVDYLAHEIGHQFGGTHTQNNDCNREPITSVEPGSGSTILGYPGICSPDVQKNSGDYFHGITLGQMGTLTQNTATCSVNTPILSAPIITGSNATGNPSVPINTPFALTATATGAIGTVLAYDWEQMDPEFTPQPPESTAVSGPNFRSFSPDVSSTRYFPNLEALAHGGPFTWEVIPSVARDMNFRVSVRNNTVGGSCNAYQDYGITFDATSGPFVVTSPNAQDNFWKMGSKHIVTWDVANTNNNIVNAQQVSILLSVDGGVTYPVLLGYEVPNNGIHTVTVPNAITGQARIMVISSTGTFFNISSELALGDPKLTQAARNPLENTSAFVYFTGIPNEMMNGTYTVHGFPGAIARIDAKNKRFVISNLNSPRKVSVSIQIAAGAFNVETNSITIPGILG